jgi:hypothetical protein
LTLGHQFDAIGNSLYVHRLGLFLNFNDFLASLLREENACAYTSARARTTAPMGHTCVRIDINRGIVGIALHLVVQVIIRKFIV